MADGALPVGRYQSSPKTLGNGELSSLLLDANGKLVTTTGTPSATGSAAKTEDTVHTTGDTGQFILGVRNDGGATTFTDTNSDYSPIAVDAKGRLLINQAPGAGVDKSITATTTSQQLMAANINRGGFWIKNDTAIVVWVNFGATAVAAAGSGNMAIAANGGYYECPAAFTPTDVINIIATSTTAAISAREY